MEYDSQGRELPDPRPMAVPAHLRLPETLQETMRRLIRVEMSRHAEAIGEESFEEADDFEIEDDELMPTPYELTPMQSEAPPGVPVASLDGEGSPPPPAGSAAAPAASTPVQTPAAATPKGEDS